MNKLTSLKFVAFWTFLLGVIGCEMVEEDHRERAAKGEVCTESFDCRFNLKCCDGVCISKSEVCGSLVELGETCGELTECRRGSCQKNDYGEGPKCFLDGGETTTVETDCASSEADSADDGTKYCKGQVGADCSLNSSICSIHTTCSEKVCKRKLGMNGAECFDSSECYRGSCQTRTGENLTRCYLDGGEEAESATYCASQRLYTDSEGVSRCQEKYN